MIVVHASLSLWTVSDVSVAAPDAADLLREYFAEMAGRYHDRPVGAHEIDAAMFEEPSEALAPPSGAFLLARYTGRPAGCVGVRLLDTHVAELKRMFVRSEMRGRGGGGLLLDAAERTARGLGATSMRLDTRHDLVEARTLYTRHGYIEIPPYSGSAYADHWFEKHLE